MRLSKCSALPYISYRGGKLEMLSELRPVTAFVDYTQLAILLQLFFCTAVPVFMSTSSDGRVQNIVP